MENDITKANQNVPATIYKPSEIIGIFNQVFLYLKNIITLKIHNTTAIANTIYIQFISLIISRYIK